MMRNILTLLVLVFAGSTLFAQTIERSLISFSGETLSNDEVTIAFSVGEPVVGTISNDENMLTQGFQQPTNDEIIEVIDDEGWKISIYPNPTVSNLNIRIYQEDYQQLHVDMLDVLGRKVHAGFILNDAGVQHQFTIPMQGLADGMYIVRVKDDQNKVVRSYKVTKVK